jgi:ferredoxin
VADELGIAIADFSKGTPVSHKDGLLVKRFIIADAVMAADGLVSLPKLKTHGLCRMTGAVKNQFGCVPGFEKKQHHARTADPYDFGTMLVDLNMAIKPRLFIMDAVMAMEGNGPRNGIPKKIGALLVSTDPVAIDAVACKIIALNPELVPTMVPGEKAGLGTYHDENIEIIGDNIENFICKDFDVVRKPVEHVASGAVRTFFKNHTSSRPVIDKTLCTKCGTCVRHCPVTPKAVDWINGDQTRPPEHNYDRCIRCFCCQELCPEGAISIKETLLGRLLFR